MSTGFPQEDAKSAFARERRRRALARIAARLRHEPDDVSSMLPFEEVVKALGRRAEHDLGVKTIPLDSIVGSVDRRVGEFDREFRPASPQLRGRWERIAAARRRGEAMPPIEVYRIGELHFVDDGHHRVSVARALGDDTIEAHVRRGRDRARRRRASCGSRDLPLKRTSGCSASACRCRPRRGRGSRCRTSGATRSSPRSSRRGASARATRASTCSRARRWRGRGSPRSTSRSSRSWPSCGAGGEGTETERYLRVAMLRFLLLHTHDWTDDVVARLLGEARAPGAEDDTLVHQILKEMR